MFDELEDPAPPTSNDAHRAAVERRARAITRARRARRQSALGVGLVVILVVGLGSVVLSTASHSSSASSVTSTTTSSSTPTAKPGAAGSHHAQSTFGPESASAANPNQLSASGSVLCSQLSPCRTPSYVHGIFKGSTPTRGFGSGPHGQCLLTDTTMPCGAGLATNHFYAATVPSGCGKAIVFDGRRWWSARQEVPGTGSSTREAWLKLSGRTQVTVVAPFGTLHLTPAVGRAPAHCTPLH